MQPPPGKFIVVTPLANCWREGRLICIENLNCDRNIENVAIHYKILSEAFPDDSSCWLKEFPDCETFPFAVRELTATILPGQCTAMAIISPVASVSALNRSYALARDKGVKLQFFELETEARRWLNLQC